MAVQWNPWKPNPMSTDNRLNLKNFSVYVNFIINCARVNQIPLSNFSQILTPPYTKLQTSEIPFKRK